MTSPREAAARRGLFGERDFRWRGGEVSRIEGFSDAVFAFAVTLLVVALEVPHDFSELLAGMASFVVFGVCFVLLIFFWYGHYIFFRRYGLQDVYIVCLNAVLLFVVLFYIYPMKFLAAMLAWQALGIVPPGTHATEGMGISWQQVGSLMVLYSAGYLTVMLLFALLYWHAWRRRALLELDPLETLITRSTLQGWLLQAGVAALSIVIALSVPSGSAHWAGWAYMLMGPVMGLHGVRHGRAVERLRARPTS